MNYPIRKWIPVLGVCVLLALPVGADDAVPEWQRAFANRIHAAWRAGDAMPQLSAAHPETTLADAYVIQNLFVAQMLAGDAIGGFKAAGVASMDPDSPLIAVMPASEVFQADDNVVIALADDPHRHVENEIGFVFSKTVAAPLETVEQLRDHVESILAIVEVPGNPVESEQTVTREDLVAWNINGKAMILGAPHDISLDVDAVEITFTRDTEVINTARGDMAAGGQWNTLLRTVNHVVRYGYTIAPGHVITNGALGTIVPAAAGKHRADYGPLGVIEFEVR